MKTLTGQFGNREGAFYLTGSEAPHPHPIQPRTTGLLLSYHAPREADTFPPQEPIVKQLRGNLLWPIYPCMLRERLAFNYSSGKQRGACCGVGYTLYLFPSRSIASWGRSNSNNGNASILVFNHKRVGVGINWQLGIGRLN